MVRSGIDDGATLARNAGIGVPAFGSSIPPARALASGSTVHVDDSRGKAGEVARAENQPRREHLQITGDPGERVERGIPARPACASRLRIPLRWRRPPGTMAAKKHS